MSATGDRIEMCACGHPWSEHEQESLMGGTCYPSDSNSCLCYQYRPAAPPAPPARLHWWADPTRHFYRVADSDRPQDGCLFCGRLDTEHLNRGADSSLPVSGYHMAINEDDRGDAPTEPARDLERAIDAATRVAAAAASSRAPASDVNSPPGIAPVREHVNQDDGWQRPDQAEALLMVERWNEEPISSFGEMVEDIAAALAAARRPTEEQREQVADLRYLLARWAYEKHSPWFPGRSWDEAGASLQGVFFRSADSFLAHPLVLAAVPSLLGGGDQ